MNMIKRIQVKRKLRQSEEKVCAAFGHYTYIKGRGEVPCIHKQSAIRNILKMGRA